MKLERTYSDDKPIWNHKVESYLQCSPVYLRRERLHVHDKKLHVQPGMEINIAHEGTATVVVGNNIYRQSSRQLILFSGQVPHQVFPDSATPYRRSVLCIGNNEPNPEMIENGFDALFDLGWFTEKRCRHFHLNMQSYTRVKRILSKMNEESMQRLPGWKRKIFSFLLDISVELERCERMESVAKESAFDSIQLTRDLVRLCSDYIEEYIYEDLSLQHVAKLFSISPEHLTRSFRKEKGLTFYQYVLLRRVTKSKQLLRSSQASMTEIAHTLGFTSSTQFSRVFRSIEKLTPTEYRLQQKNS